MPTDAPAKEDPVIEQPRGVGRAEPVRPPAPPRRLYYGWVMLGVATLAQICTSPGQTFVVGQFNPSIQAAFSLTDGQLGAMYGGATLAASLLMILVGKVSDRIGPRRLGILAAIGLGVACGLMAWSPTWTVVVMGFFLLRFAGQGSLGLVSGHVMAMWWERRLATMDSVRHLCVAGAVAVLPLITVGLIHGLGWRPAYGVLGVVVVAVMVPVMVLVAKDTPEQVGQCLDGDPLPHPRSSPAEHHAETMVEMTAGGPEERPDPVPVAGYTLRESMRMASFWILLAVSVMPPFIGTALIFNIQDLGASAGLTQGQAAALTTTWAVCSAALTLPAGWLADRLRAGPLLAVAMVLMGLSSILMLLAIHDLGTTGLLAHASLGAFGLCGALVVVVGGSSVARFFGRAHHGAIRGVFSTAMIAGTSAGPVVMGLSFDSFGRFDESLMLFAALCVPAAVAAWMLRKPAPKPL